MATAITQAGIAAGVNAFRIMAAGDYYFAEPLRYPFNTGIAIQNNAPYGRVRIFTQGFPLTHFGGPSTAADGIGIVATPTEIYGGSVSGFRNNILLAVYAATPLIGGGHVLSDVRSTDAYQIGVSVAGPNNRVEKLDIRRIGGGAVPYKPKGLQTIGAAPIIVDVDVLDMVKGPNDTETMFFHIQDGGSGGKMIGCRGINQRKPEKHFGIWWNTTTQMDLTNCVFDAGAGTVDPTLDAVAFAGDAFTGLIKGRTPLNYATVIQEASYPNVTLDLA